MKKLVKKFGLALVVLTIAGVALNGCQSSEELDKKYYNPETTILDVADLSKLSYKRVEFRPDYRNQSVIEKELLDEVIDDVESGRHLLPLRGRKQLFKEYSDGTVASIAGGLVSVGAIAFKNSNGEVESYNTSYVIYRDVSGKLRDKDFVSYDRLEIKGYSLGTENQQLVVDVALK